MLQLIDEDGRAMDDGTEPAAKSQLTWNAEAGKIRGLNAIYKRAAVLTGMGTTKLASLLDRYLESNGEVVEVGDNTTRGRASPGCVQYNPGLARPRGLECKLGSVAGAERWTTSSVDCLCIGGMVLGGCSAAWWRRMPRWPTGSSTWTSRSRQLSSGATITPLSPPRRPLSKKKCFVF